MDANDTAGGARRRFVLGGLVTLILAVLSTGVLATLNASAFNTAPQRAEAGTLSLVYANNGTGFSQGMTNLAPGDVVQRYVDLTNNGTLAAQGLTFAVTSSASNALTVDGTTTRALRIAVNACSGTWNAQTGACSATVTPLLPATPVGSLSTARDLLTTVVPAGTVTRLQVVATLPDQDEVTTNGAAPSATVQGLSTNLTFTFTQRQRSASVTNG